MFPIADAQLFLKAMMLGVSDEVYLIDASTMQMVYMSESAREKTGLDIDNFKRLNDTYGHNVGDTALQHLAKVIQTTVRPTDIVSRLGGEEFVILLPDTDLDQAVTTVKRLQRALTKQFFLANDERLLITFSAGVALLKNDETEATVIHRADQSMYLAKRTGKNRVMTEIDLNSIVES